MMKTIRVLVSCTAILVWMAMGVCRADVASTKHNLSVNGPGGIKATVESQICVFCHAPHNSSPSAPLWNRRSPGNTYTPYTSSTAKAIAGQPTGASLTCLSCHDGTIALGELLSRTVKVPMAGGAITMPAGNSNIGTDLSDDHPVSIAYTAALVAARNGELVDPSTLAGKVKLDKQGQLQCTSCHDAHDNTNGKFLVIPNTASALCVSCHAKSGWSGSDHKLSVATWNGVGTAPWPHTSGTTVAANACESCHRPHSAGGRKSLLNVLAEEGNCFTCHNGNVAAKNVQAEFNKISTHPVAVTTGVHDMTEPATIQSRHVECDDCHNPHAANHTVGTAGGSLAGALAGVRGVSISGTEVKPSTAEYQICFRCHADSTGKPAPYTNRQFVQTNTRLEFDPVNPSFHPVAGPGRSAKVPSLIAPWTVLSRVDCSDCHNNNAGLGAGGTGPNGPHGSTNIALLERPHALTSTPTAGDICYKCHSQSVVTKEAPHNRSAHLRYGCKACHDPHGISATQGNTINNSRLINLDTDDNKPVGNPPKLYVDTVARKCYLSCHGQSHNGDSY